MVGIVLALGVILTSSPARAEWSFSVTSPSGYIAIGSGGVAVGVAVVIGYVYYRGEDRSFASLPPASEGLMDNPAQLRDKRPPLDLSMDLISYRF